MSTKLVSQKLNTLVRRRFVSLGVLAATQLVAGGAAMAQSVEARHWRGITATTRQPEQVVAGTTAEWRGLWSRVGVPPPDMFEQGRTNAVGIFLGRRASEGYAVNILSTSRRRDRIVVVFEEIMPPEIMMAQRSAPRPVASAPSPSLAPSLAPSLGPSLGPGGPGSAGFAPSGAGAPATSGLAPAPSRPAGQPTSPWAIILIHRADLPVSVEQRLFR
ncbi:MAG: hypothetical protein PSV46_26430 [Reyranella sp.]|nr:hypothetical protein [Reyranella sp.]